MRIVYQSGRQNSKADALSRNPVAEASNEELELGVQIARVSSENCMEISGLLMADTGVATDMSDYSEEQRKYSDFVCCITIFRKESCLKMTRWLESWLQ